MKRTGIAIRLGVVIAVVMMSLVSVMVAQGRRGMHEGKDHGGKLEQLANKLNLTQQQKDQIRTLHEEFKTSHESDFAAMKELRQEMREHAKNKDRDAMQATREKMHAKMTSIKTDREVLDQQVKAILTAEQQKQLEGLREEMQAKRREHRENRRKHHKNHSDFNSEYDDSSISAPESLD